MEGIFVMVEELPKSIRAVTIPFDNGFYIVLNSVYNSSERKIILQEEERKIRSIRKKG